MESAPQAQPTTKQPPKKALSAHSLSQLLALQSYFFRNCKIGALPTRHADSRACILRFLVSTRARSQASSARTLRRPRDPKISAIRPLHLPFAAARRAARRQRQHSRGYDDKIGLPGACFIKDRCPRHPVSFAIAEDVSIGGVLLLPAGTPVSGIVTKVVRGVAGKRPGLLRIRIREIAVAGNSPIRLTNSDPEYRQSRSDRFNEGSINTLETIGAVVLLPLELPMAIGMSSGDNSKPAGNDAVLPRCWSAEYWVAVSSPIEISSSLQTGGPGNSTVQDGCVTGQEKPVIDWSASDWQVLEVE